MVAVSIIAALLAILLPALARSRAVGQQSRCQSNLRQLGLALEMYAGNRDDWYPSWSRWHAWGYYGTAQDGTDGDQEGPAWPEQMRDDALLPRVEALTCPGFPQSVSIAYFLSAYAAWDRHGEQATRRAWITRPAEFVLSGDCTNPVFFRPPFGTNQVHSFNDSDIDNADVEAPDWSRPLHLDKNLNILFSDGHAGAYSDFNPAAMTLDTQLPGIAWGELSE
jgi:prepilin-type processing-associated H-X9-DG protein